MTSPVPATPNSNDELRAALTDVLARHALARLNDGTTWDELPGYVQARLRNRHEAEAFELAALVRQLVEAARADERNRIAAEQLSSDAAWHSVWLHGHWRLLTSKMTTEEREAAVTAIERHRAHAGMSWDIDPSSLRWWHDGG